METKNNPGPNSCYAKALPDEPMFILLGRDLEAPAAIRGWAIARLERIGPDDPEYDKIKAEALADVDGFKRWREENDGKWRDAQPMVIEHPSERATSMAGRAVNDDPLADPAVILRINDELAKAGQGFEGKGIDDLRSAVQTVLKPYFDERQSMAGALLRLDPKAGQGGR